MAAACRVSTWTYLHIHLLLLAGQVEGSQHAISSSRPNHFVRFINLHRPIQGSVLLPSQIHEGPVADTNCVARWIATTKTFSFDDSQLVKCDKTPTFIEKWAKWATSKVLVSRRFSYLLCWLVVYLPLWKIFISQWEGLSHILWKIKNVPNHQPVCVCNPQHFSKKTWRDLHGCRISTTNRCKNICSFDWPRCQFLTRHWCRKQTSRCQSSHRHFPAAEWVSVDWQPHNWCSQRPHSSILRKILRV